MRQLHLTQKTFSKWGNSYNFILCRFLNEVLVFSFKHLLNEVHFCLGLFDELNNFRSGISFGLIKYFFSGLVSDWINCVFIQTDLLNEIVTYFFCYHCFWMCISFEHLCWMTQLCIFLLPFFSKWAYGIFFRKFCRTLWNELFAKILSEPFEEWDISMCTPLFFLCGYVVAFFLQCPFLKCSCISICIYVLNKVDVFSLGHLTRWFHNFFMPVWWMRHLRFYSCIFIRKSFSNGVVTISCG